MTHRSHRRVLKVVSLVCIALALAVTTAIFTVVDGLHFRPLPFKEPEQLAVLKYRDVAGQVPPVAYEPTLAHERERLRVAIVESGFVKSFTEIQHTGLFAPSAAQLGINPVQVDTNFFEVFGFNAARGSLQAEDLLRSIESNSATTVVLGHGLWQRLGQPELGPLSLDGRDVFLAAVMPPEAKFPGETNVWSVSQPSLVRPPTHVRLTPGTDASALTSRIGPMDVRPLRAAMQPKGSERVMVLLFAAGLLVLIAWVQLAGLTVAELLTRMRDFGVQLSLGATPLRLFASSLSWHAATAASVGLGALVTTPVAIRLFATALPAEQTYGQYFALDWRSVAFLSTAVAVGFGLLACSPIWALRLPPASLLRRQVDGVASKVSRTRRILVITQISVGAALLYVTGLLGHSLANAVRYDYGFAAENVFLFEPPFPAGGSEDFEHRDREKGRLTRATVEALNADSDVVAAAVLYHVPLAPPKLSAPWQALRSFNGRPANLGSEVYCTTVGRQFVSALGASVVQGRDLSHPDHVSRTDVALVNVTFARMFGGSIQIGDDSLPIDVVGKRIETTWFKGTIVGVVTDLVFAKVTDTPVPQVFIPERQVGSPPYVAIRTVGNSGLNAGVKARLEQLWGPLPDHRFSRLKDYWDISLIPYRGQAQVVALLTLFAIPLTAIGLASFMLFLIRSENRATAIRLAIGAEPAQIQREVLIRGAATAAIGAGGGILVGVTLGRLMSANLFGVDGLDVASLVLTSLFVGFLSVAATWLPARLAGDTDPSILLRESLD